jgi:hypothetical protein
MTDPNTSNPTLAELALLVGDWDMALSGASFLPDPEQVIHGYLGCSWIEGGAALAMHQGGEPSTPPTATWIIGRDEASPDYSAFYSDDRGVSRIYVLSLMANEWRLWRDNASFSQRFQARVSEDRNSIVGHWEKASDGQEWEHDFNVTYSRLS